MISPTEISSKGDKLYQERFRQQYEVSDPGKFLAIDVATETAFVADSPEAAIQAAQQANPNGFFHLVRIGSSGVYRVGYTQSRSREWQL